MKIRAMNMGFGAQVEEADLTSLTHDDVDQLQTALLEHGLLVVRNQKLSPAGQVRMSEVFGTLGTFPPGEGQLADYPQIFRVLRTRVHIVKSAKCDTRMLAPAVFRGDACTRSRRDEALNPRSDSSLPIEGLRGEELLWLCAANGAARKQDLT